MKTEKEIVLKAAEGITFRLQEDGERIVIEAINKPSSEDCSDNYKNPKIPEGYVHLKGTWRDGFVIQNQADGSEFVWIPVGWLNADATLDGKNFNEKFGRKNWNNSNFSKEGYHEEVVNDSTSWGNYWNTPESPQREKPTGSNEKWCVLNIYDLAGNMDEWTSEMLGNSGRVLRGGCFFDLGYMWPAVGRNASSSDKHYSGTSFRAVLYLK